MKEFLKINGKEGVGHTDQKTPKASADRVPTVLRRAAFHRAVRYANAYLTAEFTCLKGKNLLKQTVPPSASFPDGPT